MTHTANLRCQPDYGLLMLILAFVLVVLFLLTIACTKPDEDCYECHNRQMPSVTYCGYTPDEIKAVHDWWGQYGDSLDCELDTLTQHIGE